ncbi:hypothetical protein EUGRSUZ_F00961 [Eucalyptus grandis]|uniref:Protein kinase domain-containing protein n=3 Tax=Eucalyptus grandis TaxID=71139 RepID=A0A059BLQ8_EUCGR|nr:hypothetical protein EUGRSUZ_F00961 [Eucalyptus grandis]KAK3424158.1 hypothetical protein EUGRSUZ_F00961 [Eucalyptus grandis]
MRQFKQEIQVLSQLRHPNILQYYGSEIVEDQLNVYLEYAHHGSIDKYIKERLGTLTESVVRTFTYDIVTGLASLHVNNSIHGDLKGANLFVDASGIVRLADFGIAKHHESRSCCRHVEFGTYYY